jgi:hypothetical protein
MSEIMDSLTRRRAIGLGVLTGSALVAEPGQAEAAGEKDVIFADEKAVVFNIRNVTIERVDQAARTITASFGKQDNPIKMTDLPLGKDIRIVLTNRCPSFRNHEPFEWRDLEELVGRRVSMRLRAESSGLSVHSFATAND